MSVRVFVLCCPAYVQEHVQSSSVEDMPESFHDFSDDATDFVLGEFRPICWHRQEQEVMADAFRRPTFVSGQGNGL